MDKYDICSCDCGCTDKYKTPPEVPLLYATRVDPSDESKCDNCRSGKHKTKVDD